MKIDALCLAEEFVSELERSKKSSLCMALVSTQKFKGFNPNFLLSTSLSVPLATDIGNFEEIYIYDEVVNSHFNMAA
ncbi:TPA: hypothetical protein P2R03_004295 [Aeromonas veronii]|nr:hypothetical protein [Aeromonas veronii]